MATRQHKHVILFLIVFLLLFSVSFSFHITANTSQPIEDESSIPVINSTVSVESTTSQEENVSDPTESDPSVSDYSSDTSEQSAPFDELSSDQSTLDGTSDGSINSDSESMLTSDQIPSQEVSSLVVSAVSEGGAPDFTDEQYYNDGSYVYHGSYAGIGSEVPSDEKTDEEKKDESPKRTPAAQRYANYAKWGMIIFGILSLAMIALLVFFNLKVRESKLLHPEWYSKKKQTSDRRRIK